jgi:hypothetical protein
MLYIELEFQHVVAVIEERGTVPAGKGHVGIGFRSIWKMKLLHPLAPLASLENNVRRHKQDTKMGINRAIRPRQV